MKRSIRKTTTIITGLLSAIVLIYIVCFSYLFLFFKDLNFVTEYNKNSTLCIQHFKDRVKTYFNILDLNRCMDYNNLTFYTEEIPKIEGEIHFHMDNSIDVRLGEDWHTLKIRKIEVETVPIVIGITQPVDTIWLADDGFEASSEAMKNPDSTYFLSVGIGCAELSEDPDSVITFVTFYCENMYDVTISRKPSKYLWRKDQDALVIFLDGIHYTSE